MVGQRPLEATARSAPGGLRTGSQLPAPRGFEDWHALGVLPGCPPILVAFPHHPYPGEVWPSLWPPASLPSWAQDPGCVRGVSRHLCLPCHPVLLVTPGGQPI